MGLVRVIDNRVAGRITSILLGEGETLSYVPPEILKNVVFLGYKDANSLEHIIGSAFWIVNESYAHHPAYLVTAKHVLQDINDKTNGGGMSIRYNPVASGEADWQDVCIQRWEPHPDKNIDIAYLQYAMFGDHGCWPMDSFVTDKSAKEDFKDVDLGDEVFFPGWFWPIRTTRNVPIVRFGNIAALPGEPVDTKNATMPVYLVEARSIGGMSGSPVYIDVLRNRIAKEIPGGTMRVGPSRFRLLGLVNGHFKGTEKELSPDDVKKIDPQELDRLNMGIAFVTPSQIILEGLKVFMDGDEKASEEFKTRNRAFIALDSASQPNVAFQTTFKGAEIPVPSKDEFFDSLQKATKKK